MSAARILIVDDEPLIRWCVGRHLERAGYDVVQVECGGRAPESWRAGIDLALLDLRLPDIDGLTLLEQMRGECPGCPVIVMTAFGSAEVQRRARALGAFEVVEKPFDLAHLTALVRQALNGVRASKSSA